jgi:penicillin-binding protein 2
LHLRIIQNCHHFSGKWWLWTTIAGPIASLMIEPRKNNKKLRNKDSKTSLKEYAKLGGMKEANAIETTPKDSISIDNVVNTSAPIDSTNQN